MASIRRAKVELEKENGNVVYGVEIKTANGESDVKVDAGDGRMLHVEKDGKTTNLHDLSSFGATMNEGGTVKQCRLTRRAAFLILRGLK